MNGLAAPHRFDLTVREAIALQQEMRERVETEERFGVIGTVGGVDVGFTDGGRMARAAAVTLRYPDLAGEVQAIACRPVTFPYVPGLLSFREIPVILAALEQLPALPDLILCDGQGYAHPRRFGIACHLGVILDRSTIGVAKSRLVGQHAEPGPGRGDWTPLTDGGGIVGAVLRTRARVRPLYVSAGHRITLATAIDWVMRCTRRYRLPEPVRMADRLASGR